MKTKLYLLVLLTVSAAKICTAQVPFTGIISVVHDRKMLSLADSVTVKVTESALEERYSSKETMHGFDQNIFDYHKHILFHVNHSKRTVLIDSTTLKKNADERLSFSGYEFIGVDTVCGVAAEIFEKAIVSQGTGRRLISRIWLAKNLMFAFDTNKQFGIKQPQISLRGTQRIVLKKETASALSETVEYGFEVHRIDSTTKPAIFLPKDWTYMPYSLDAVRQMLDENK